MGWIYIQCVVGKTAEVRGTETGRIKTFGGCDNSHSTFFSVVVNITFSL